MKKNKTTINKILDILIWMAVAFIVRNLSAPTRGCLVFGGELGFPIVATWYHFFAGKAVIKDFIQDMRGA